MRCNEFDAHIDEMLSGVLHPDANQHMRQCERCTSHFRARAVVQSGLRALAAASAKRPSRATDRSVMDSYRRLQQGRAGTGSAQPAAAVSTARMVSFPSRSISGSSMAPGWASRTWWSGAAAAAVVFAVMGSAVHLWKGVPTAGESMVATAPSAPVGQQIAAAIPAERSAVASLVSRRRQAHRPAQGISLAALQTKGSSSTLASSAAISEQAEPRLSASASARPAVAYEGSNYDSTPVTQLAPNVAPVIRLASTGAMNNVAQSASSTWPGYSNLMYCDPVVCSGPMQVVHIKVPVGQVRPNLGQTMGNAFVNAEVVVGPDGVARAIRVGN